MTRCAQTFINDCSSKLTCYHDGFGVATEAVLKQPGEDGVSVGDEAVPATTAGQRAGMTAHSTALPLTQHAVNALTAAAHLRVLGWRRIKARELGKD